MSLVPVPDPDYLSKLPHPNLLQVLSGLSPKTLKNLESTNKKMRAIIQKDSEYIYDLKIKKDFAGVSPRVLYALFEFTKMHYPFIVSLFIINDKKMSELSLNTIEPEINLLTDRLYDSMISYYKPPTEEWGHYLFYLYKLRFLNIKYHTPSFNKQYEEALANAKSVDQVKFTMQRNLAWVITTLNATNQKIAADINLANKMRTEWEHIYTQMVAKVTELNIKRLARLKEIEEEIEAVKQKKAAAAKLSRETRKEAAAATAAEEEAAPSTSGRVTRSRTRNNQ